MRWREYCNKILTTIDPEAFYLDEFKRLGQQVMRHGSEIKTSCPFKELHASGQDSKPSFTVNLNGVYFCNACGSKGNIHTFYMLTRKLSKEQAWFELGDALGIERPTDVDSRPAIDPGLPITWHKALMDNSGVIREILSERRGLTNETLQRFMIGWDGARVTIPIYDESSELVNIRLYKWNSLEDSFKMINYTDEFQNTYGENRIYGIEHLVDDGCKKVLWCEGEWDRLLAEQNGFAACTATAGANNFKAEWFKLLRTKEEVYVCYDNDDAGRRATSYMVDNLRGHVKLYSIQWPKDWYDKGDITDYFAKDKNTAESFQKLFNLISSDDVATVPLAFSSNAKYTGRRIKIPILIAGKENAPYIYPKSVSIVCNEGSEDSKLCACCALLSKHEANIQMNSSRSTMLKLINCAEDEQFAMLRALAGCASKCTRAEIRVKEYGNLETIHIIPKADENFGFSAHQEYVARSGYVLGNNIPTNKRFNLVGYMHADPRSQKATYIFDEAIPEKDLADDFVMSPELFQKLSIFKCSKGQSVLEKFTEIHEDLERNVTYIWNRRKVAYAVDLIYHTAISFKFQEQNVKRGWAECLIIGDSGQAKTTLVERLMAHYKCGDLLSGEATRRTGLVYSLQQLSSKGTWSIMWGAMPLNDGGLLCVDELSGMSEDDLSKMSDVRSSGIAKSTGVVIAETTARTRMIFISNPRNGRQLRAENYGVSAILKLFGKAEDVRRLDFAIGVASGEVATSVVNTAVTDMPPVEHRYTSDLCKLRVLWAWSRRSEDIVFRDDAVQAILDGAVKMGEKYSSRIPLVEPADQRLKIARLAISAAACVFSTDETGTQVIVEKEHVEFVIAYLNSVYDSKALGYDRFSSDDFESSDTTEGAIAKIRAQFISIPIANRSIEEVVKALYQLPYFSRNTLEDATGLDRDELRELMQCLISNSLIEKAGQDYKRTPLGLSFIESMLMNPATLEEIRETRSQRFKKSEL